jgi:hypothetical protein
MDELDLEIDNYSLKDILNLFGLNSDFGEEQLKHAKRIVLKTHPDKSNLKKEVFIFFSKAYKMLLKVYYFKNKTEKEVTNMVYNSSDIDNVERNQDLLDQKLKGKSRDDFSSWFNKMFEDSHKDKKTAGYGDWLKSDEDVNEIKAKNMNEFDRIFREKKQKGRELVLRKGITDIYSSTGVNSSMLDKSEEVEYSSNIFSKLKYEDLKKAHVETVVPVTEQDFTDKKRFDNVEQYLRYREQNKGKVMNKVESTQYLNNLSMKREEIGTQRAYNLLMEEKEMEKRNNLWWKNLKLLN